jgi:ABC-type Fe3+ transport system permease subunit
LEFQKTNIKVAIEIIVGIIAITIFLSFIGIFIGLIFNGTSLNEMLNSFFDFLKANGTTFLYIGIIVALIGFVAVLIVLAADRKKGRIYKIVEVINAICIIFLIFVGLWCLVEGMHKLYTENFNWFILVICAAAFSLYYWIRGKFF